MKKLFLLLLAVGPLLSGCTVVSANRVFPKLAWSWSADAKEQRREDAILKANAEAEKERNRLNNGQ